jgi:hypothetical protein
MSARAIVIGLAAIGLAHPGPALAGPYCLDEVAIAQPPTSFGNPSPKKDRPVVGQRMSQDPQLVPGMRIVIEAQTNGWLEVYGHIAFQREGKDRDPLDNYLASVQLKLNGRWINGTKSGANFIEQEHYHIRPFASIVRVEPGRQVIEVFARAQPKGNDHRIYYKASKDHLFVAKLYGEC